MFVSIYSSNMIIKIKSSNHSTARSVLLLHLCGYENKVSVNNDDILISGRVTHGVPVSTRQASASTRGEPLSCILTDPGSSSFCMVSILVHECKVISYVNNGLTITFGIKYKPRADDLKCRIVSGVHFYRIAVIGCYTSAHRM